MNIKLCSICKTGMLDLALDRSSVICSHIVCLKNGRCSKFVELDEIDDIKSKINRHKMI